MPTLACGQSTVPPRSIGALSAAWSRSPMREASAGCTSGEQDRELVGAEAHEGVAAAEAGLEAPRRRVQQAVAGGIAQAPGSWRGSRRGR
jgi:hypothetical protein